MLQKLLLSVIFITRSSHEKKECIKLPTTWYSSTTQFLNLDFFLPKIFRLFPHLNSSQQHSYYRVDDIASPFPIFHVIFFPTAIIFPSPLHNLIFFPNRFDQLPPPRSRGLEYGNLYTPWCKVHFKTKMCSSDYR